MAKSLSGRVVGRGVRATLAAAVVLTLLVKPIRRLMSGVH